MTARNARRRSSDPEPRHLAQCLAASVAVPTVSFATLDALSFAIAAGLTFLMLGCVGALWRLVRTEAALPGNGPRPPGSEPHPPHPQAPTFTDTGVDDTAPIPVIRADPVPSRARDREQRR